jgi:hypothetical protein
MSKIIDTGSYGCIYYPGIDCNGNVVKQDVVSKLVDVDHANHEIKISTIIRKIKEYKHHFLPVLKSCMVQKFHTEKCKLVQPKQKYKILYIPYKHHVEQSLSFQQMYHSLLQSVKLLIQHKLVHFDINANNIICSDNIYLIDFGLSIDIKHIHSQLKERFYTYAIYYDTWPLEVHLLCYMLNKGPITLTSLRSICSDFVKHNIILQHSTSEFVKEYLNSSIEYYSDLTHLSSKESIYKCIQYWKTWDNYALIIYLFKKGYDIPTKYLKNIHYLPTERLSVDSCLAATSA